MLTVLTLVLRSSAASPSVVGVVQSSEAGDHWKAQPDLVFAKDNFKNSSNSVSIHTKIIKQEVMGFGAAMTDTSAYNAMVWMDSDTQDAYFQALWGKTGLGLTLGRVTLNSVSEGQYTRGCNSEKDCRQFTIIKTNTAHCLFVFFFIKKYIPATFTCNIQTNLKADYSYESFNYDSHGGDFNLSQFDNTLAYVTTLYTARHAPHHVCSHSGK